MHEQTNRRAALVSTLVAVRSAQDPEPLIAVGRVSGEISREPLGSNGFGFDPVMYIPQFGLTFAQLPVAVKNANSHRGRSARAMVQLMRERWLNEVGS
jgi:XTP/dITP diphosphohydrolase